MAATSRQTWYLLLLERTQSFVTALTALVVIVLLRASSHSLYYVLGSLVTAWTAKGLKRFIRQPRPVYEDEDETRSPTTRRRKKVKSHGMPSTHSATITFMGAYLYLAIRSLEPTHTLTYVLPASLIPVLLRCTSGFALLFPPLVLYSRIALRYHTLAQAFCGAALGLVVASAWFVLWNGFEYGPIIWTDGVASTVEPHLDPVVRRFWNRVGIKAEGEL